MLRVKQNAPHFSDDILQYIAFNENAAICIKISLKYMPMDLIGNKADLVQIMACPQTGDRPLLEPMMA